MPKYRFKDDKITFSDIMNLFTVFEDTYSEVMSNSMYPEYAEELHSVIINANEDAELAKVEMYNEEKNGAIVFSIRSKYKCLRVIACAKINLSRCQITGTSLFHLALTYLEALEYFFTYSYTVRDEVKQELNSKYGYFK